MREGGLPQDLPEALRWLLRADVQEFPRARHAINVILTAQNDARMATVSTRRLGKVVSEVVLHMHSARSTIFIRFKNTTRMMNSQPIH